MAAGAANAVMRPLNHGLFEDSEYQIIFAAFAESPLVTPEPGTLLVVGSGLAGFVVIAWRRRSRRP